MLAPYPDHDGGKGPKKSTSFPVTLEHANAPRLSDSSDLDAVAEQSSV